MSRARWIHSLPGDVALAFCWVPFVAAALAVQDDRSAIGGLLTATFALSFAHQPLTLPIVYGDPEERATRPRLYRWAPLAFVVAAAGGLSISVAAVAVVAGLWNAEHTLMQRFGITRIYGRKAGEDDPAVARLEKAMLCSWLALAAAVAAAQAATAHRITRLPLGEVNAEGLRLLTGLRTGARWLLPGAVLVAGVLTARWVAAEAARWRAGGGNPAKLLYLGATAGLIAVLLVQPIAGFVGYIGAHAVEYFVIVHRALPGRWADPGAGGWIGRVARARWGRARFLVGYAVAIGGLLAALQWYGEERVYLLVVLVLGGMHVLYDGFIWKLRRPAVAAALVGADRAQLSRAG